MSCTAWSILSLVLLACALALFLVYLLAQRLSLRKAGFYGTVVAVLLCMLTTWFALGRTPRKMLDDTSAVVMTASTAVKSSPDKSSTDFRAARRHGRDDHEPARRLVRSGDRRRQERWLECRKIETI